MNKNNRNRSGAALIIALVLLAVIGVIASTVLAQMLRDRQETRLDLICRQADLLLDDALRIAERQREADSEFTGKTITIGSDQQPFPGTFRITTQYQSEIDRFAVEVEYSNEKGKLIHVAKR